MLIDFEIFSSNITKDSACRSFEKGATEHSENKIITHFWLL